MACLLLQHDIVSRITMLNDFKHIKFLKFIAVGALNTANGYFIFITFLYLGLHYSLAALFANVIVVLINFKTYGRFVFNSRDNRLIFRFASVYIFIYFLTVICLRAFSLLSFNLYVGSLILTIPFALLSFFLNNRYVFHKDIKKFNCFWTKKDA